MNRRFRVTTSSTHALAVALLATVAVTACDSRPTGPQPTLPPELVGLNPEGLIPFAWIGSYGGSGNGVVGGMSASFPSAMLVIAFDADSVATSRCPQCVTIAVDTLFTLTNVGLDDPVGLDIQYVTGSTRRRLILSRFSDGSTDGTGTILSGRLLLEDVGGGLVQADISYLFERR